MTAYVAKPEKDEKSVGQTVAAAHDGANTGTGGTALQSVPVFSTPFDGLISFRAR